MERNIVRASAQHLQGWRSAADALTAQTRGDNRDTNFITQVVVVGGAVNHVCVGRGIGTDGVHRQL